MIIVEIFPICDQCSESFPDYRNPAIVTQKRMKQVMKDAGWTRRKGKDLCPTCSKEAND